MDVKPVVSSTFGETRSTAFHAGIDLKTWGTTGHKVYAVADGYVFRVRTSPWGYGRAVYQRLKDDRIVVYAHLESFSEFLAKKVRAEQNSTGRYTVDLWFQPNQLPIRHGQMIAKSGESGAGPPHLHLELRDKNNIPVNPLTNGYSITDLTNPTLKRVAFFPLSSASRVDGRPHPYSIDLILNAKTSQYEYDQAVRIHGRIGVSIDCYDQADGATNKLAPLSNTLYVNGIRYFQANYDAISYANSHQFRMDRQRFPSADKLHTYFSLFKLPGNRLSFYDRITDTNSGILHCGVDRTELGIVGIGKGRHQLEFESEDANGNKARALVEVLVNADPKLINPRLLAVEDESRTLEIEIEDFDDDVVTLVLSRTSREGKWQKMIEEKIAVKTNPLTYRLDRDIDTRWRVEAIDSFGGSDAVILFADSVRRPRLQAKSVQVYGDFLTLSVTSEADLPGYPSATLVFRTKAGIEEFVNLKDLKVAIGVWQIAPFEFEIVANLPVLRKVVMNYLSREKTEIDVLGEAELLISTPHDPLPQIVIPINLEVVTPGHPANLMFAKESVFLAFLKGSAYEPIFPQAYPISINGTDELQGTGPGYEFGPTMVSFDKPVKVGFRVAKRRIAMGKMALYRENEKGVWVFLGNKLSSDSTRIIAPLTFLTKVALFEDVTPPTILARNSGKVSYLNDIPHAPTISVQIEDGGSGIGDEMDLAMGLNGTPIIAEYDPEANLLMHRLRKPLIAGEHTLQVTARDRCGNEVFEQLTFSVR